MQPTLQEIAEHCGVSKTTVSLALRNHPKISTATRERIERAAHDLGYQTNPLVAAHMAMLRMRNTGQYKATLGVVSDWPIDELINASDAAAHYSETAIGRYLKGIKSRSKELGFEIDLVSLAEPKMTVRRIGQILESRGIRGIILTPLSLSEGSLDLDWSKFSTVALGYSMRSPLVHRVCHDNYSSMRIVMRYLAELGFERIRMAMDIRDDVRVKNLWTAGYQSRSAFWQGYENAENLLTRRWEKKVFLEWLERERPDVVISIGDTAYDWARSEGYRIPEDLALITLGKIGGRISGFSQCNQKMGAAAVEKLVSLLHCNETGVPKDPQTLLVQGEWIHGETLGRCCLTR